MSDWQRFDDDQVLAIAPITSRPGVVAVGTESGRVLLFSLAEAAAEAIRPGAMTAADLRMIVAQAIRAQPRRDWRTDVALVIAVMSLVIAWLAYRQDAAQYAHPDPPPSVTVVVERANADEIARQVGERLREHEERQAEHVDDQGKAPPQPGR